MMTPKRIASDCQGVYAALAHVAEGHHGGPEQADQPRGFAWHICKQIFRSPSQFGPITSGAVGGATCWVPTVGGRVGVPRTLTHRGEVILACNGTHVLADLILWNGREVAGKTSCN